MRLVEAGATTLIVRLVDVADPGAVETLGSLIQRLGTEIFRLHGRMSSSTASTVSRMFDCAAFFAALDDQRRARATSTGTSSPSNWGDSRPS